MVKDRQKRTRLYGIFGEPLGHTLSPVFQEAGFQKKGIRAFYLVLEMNRERLKKVMQKRSSLLLDGFNVTVPHKEEIFKWVDGVTPEAKAIRAVNTVYRKGKRWIGTNTDVTGFLKALKQDGRFRIKGKRVLMLGAGGAARAAVYGLLKSGAKYIWIANRHPDRAEKISKEFKKNSPRSRISPVSLKSRAFAAAVMDADLIVNATSLGLKPNDPSPLKASLIPKAAGRNRKLFFDLIYSPERTPFLRAGAGRGHRTLGGLGMLLYQGTEAFQLWTGKAAPVPAMRAALVSARGRG